MTASSIKFRCSSLGYIMTEPRGKNETLSETCKNHLIDVYVSAKYNRQTNIDNKYIQKGLQVEEDSLTLYSLHKGFFYKKNKDRIENDFIIGTPDIILFDKSKEVFSSVWVADTIIDIKSSWDIFTFFRNANPDKLNKNYYWQLQGYMALTGATKSILAYCLVDTPGVLINDEKRKLLWKMGALTEMDENYAEACREIDRLSIYDDVPRNERVIEIFISRNDADIKRLYKRVEECRKYMDEFLFKA